MAKTTAFIDKIDFEIITAMIETTENTTYGLSKKLKRSPNVLTKHIKKLEYLNLVKRKPASKGNKKYITIGNNIHNFARLLKDANWREINKENQDELISLFEDFALFLRIEVNDLLRDIKEKVPHWLKPNSSK